jgi:hypothetical protein
MAKAIGVSHHALAEVPRQFPNGLAEARADDQTGSDIVRVMRKKHDPCGSEAQQADPNQWLR